MRTDSGTRSLRAETAIALTTAKRGVRSAVIWGALFGLLIGNEALNYQHNFPTAASRQVFARSFGANAALAAVTGVGRQLDTLEGFVTWRVFGLLMIVGAVWGLLTGTRLVRGEEDAGRWELFLAGTTTRRRAALQALAGLAAGSFVLWVVTAAITVAAGSRPSVGLPTSGLIFYATAATASAVLFLAVGAFTSQLGRTRRQANALAVAALAVSVVLRMIADGVAGMGWMRWASPLGWIENLHPLTTSQPWALVPVVLAIAAAAWGAVTLAGRRDLGAGTLARADSASVNYRWLGGPTVLVVRLERWVALAWIAGLGVLAAIFGVVAASAGGAKMSDAAVEKAVARLGGTQGGAAAWIGYEFLYLAALLAFAAAAQISAMRSEEADGQLDHLLARPVGRGRWLAGRMAFGVALVALAGLAAGVGGWLGLATGANDVTLTSMLLAGLNITVPAVFILGAGSLLYGLSPRLAVPITYGLVLWSFVIAIIGSTVTTNRWLLDTSVLSRLNPVPAAGLDWSAAAWLTGLGAIAALGGFAALRRRDLASA